MNHFKLVGVYDKKIQKGKPKDRRTSCLALALAESEAAHRADALTNLNPASSMKKNGKRQFRAVESLSLWSTRTMKQVRRPQHSPSR
jgi:hypothetical protein